MKTNVSELLKTCRNGRNGIETGLEKIARDESGGHLSTAQTVPGIKVA